MPQRDLSVILERMRDGLEGKAPAGHGLPKSLFAIDLQPGRATAQPERRRFLQRLLDVQPNGDAPGFPAIVVPSRLTPGTLPLRDLPGRPPLHAARPSLRYRALQRLRD